MVEFKQISRLLKKKQDTDLTGLAPTYKELTDIKRYVPYLRDFKFTHSSNIVGDFKSAFKGRGIEFEEVRAYNFGDDVRDIDWRVTARKNSPFTKLYAQEKDRKIYVWLDLSSSMRFGTKKELKSVTAAKITALLGWFTLANRDRFGLIVFDGNKTYIFEPKRDYENLLIVLKKIEEISKESLSLEYDVQKKVKSLQLATKRIGRKSIVFLVSDVDISDESIKQQILMLSSGNDVCVVHVYDALEENAPPKGEYLAQYADVKQLLVSSGKAYDKQYISYFLLKRQRLKDFCTKFNCRYRQVRNDLPIVEQLRPI